MLIAYVFMFVCAVCTHESLFVWSECLFNFFFLEITYCSNSSHVLKPFFHTVRYPLSDDGPVLCPVLMVSMHRRKQWKELNRVIPYRYTMRTVNCERYTKRSCTKQNNSERKRERAREKKQQKKLIFFTPQMNSTQQMQPPMKWIQQLSCECDI